MNPTITRHTLLHRWLLRLLRLLRRLLLLRCTRLSMPRDSLAVKRGQQATAVAAAAAAGSSLMLPLPLGSRLLIIRGDKVDHGRHGSLRKSARVRWPDPADHAPQLL